jgi:LSD1 subclass zinc finger protein
MSVTPAKAGAQLDPGLRRDDSSAFIRTFPCVSCGAKLAFAPGTRHLKCEFCGAENSIAENDARVEELDFDAYLKAIEGKGETFEAETAKCEKCGAEQRLPDHHFAAQCGFCSAPIVAKTYAKRLVKPRAMVPFQLDRRRAQDEFRRWVKGLWLAPGELKRYAQSDAAMTGTYLPFWTYDCATASDYDGERGEDYYTDESYTTRNAAGETVTQVRRVKHTNWFPASGHVEHFHDDVLVLASQSLPPTMRGAASAWNLKALVPYQAEFVSGYLAEAYQIGLCEGFPIAKDQIDATIYGLVRADIGGDQQRVRNVSTRYTDVRFKHVLLPVWMSAYRFRNKTYRFLVNGQTGEVAGDSPISWQKVTWLVAAAIICFILILIFGSGSR